MTIGVVILGAGASRRMGRPKLLLPWRNTTLLQHLVGQWARLNAARIALVIAPGMTLLQAGAQQVCPDIAFVENPQPESGMMSSILCAARWAKGRDEIDISHWVLALGDQPQIPMESLRLILEAARLHPGRIVQPSRLGRGRHPVVFPARVFEELADTTAPDLKQFLASHSGDRHYCAIEDDRLEVDVDTPGDYQLAWVQWGQPGHND